VLRHGLIENRFLRLAATIPVDAKDAMRLARDVRSVARACAELSRLALRPRTRDPPREGKRLEPVLERKPDPGRRADEADRRAECDRADDPTPSCSEPPVRLARAPGPVARAGDAGEELLRLALRPRTRDPPREVERLGTVLELEPCPVSRADKIDRAECGRADEPRAPTLLRGLAPFDRAVARGAAPAPRTGALMERPTCLGLGTARADGAVRRAGRAEADGGGAIGSDSESPQAPAGWQAIWSGEQGLWVAGENHCEQRLRPRSRELSDRFPSPCCCLTWPLSFTKLACRERATALRVTVLQPPCQLLQLEALPVVPT